MAQPAILGAGFVPFFDDNGKTGGDEALNHLQVAAAANKSPQIGLLVDVVYNLPGADVAVFPIRFEEGGGFVLGSRVAVKIEIDGQIGRAAVVEALWNDF